MKENYLRLATEKTECVMLTTKRGYRQPDTRVVAKKKLKYIGIELCMKLGYGTHINGAAVRAGRKAGALERILPNVRGASQDKRKNFTFLS